MLAIVMFSAGFPTTRHLVRFLQPFLKAALSIQTWACPPKGSSAETDATESGYAAFCGMM